MYAIRSYYVAVSIEGSTDLPVITDENGSFSLSSPSGEEWMMVAPASGYKKKRIFLNNRTNLVIILTPEDMSSGDDVITSYSIHYTKLYDQAIPFSNFTMAVNSKTGAGS